MMSSINHILQSGLPEGVQNLCVYVLHNADEDGWCRDTQEEIASHLGVSRSTVSRRESKTDLLTRDGHQIRVETNGGQNVPQTSQCEADGTFQQEAKCEDSAQKCEADAQKCEADGTFEAKCEADAQKCEADGTSPALTVLRSGEPQTPQRKKKVSTPSKKNSNPPSDTPSLRSGVSGDGAQNPAELDLDCGLPEDDTGHPAVGIFRSKAQFHPSEYNRKRLIDVVGEVGTDQFSNRIGPWRKTVEEWRQRNYNWSNFDGLMDRYVDKLEAYGYVNRSDYDGSIDLPDGEDVTAEEAGYAHLLEEG
jgi:biotin operon repressor